MATSKGREADSLNAADDLQVEEVALEDDWRVTEGEEDWEATMRAIRARAEASAAAAAYGRDTGAAACPAQQPEATDDFLRNFLTDTGMTNTLECFQSEWHEMVQKGLIKTESIVSVPDVYTENQHLENELRNTKREQEEYLRAAAAAAEALTRARKARDYYRLQHKCVVQEKSKLIQEMRKLKLKCASYEPAVRQMNEKYQAALKQMMLVSLERDKALGQETHLETVHPSSRGTGEEAQSPKEGRGGRCQRENPSNKPAEISKHSKDSEIPKNMPASNLLPHGKHQSVNVPTKAKADSFPHNNTIKTNRRPVN